MADAGMEHLMRDADIGEVSPDTKTPGIVLALLASVIFVGVVNGTTVNVALPFIGQAFGVTEATYGWIVTGYAMTFAVFSSILGKLADSWGVRRIYVGGMIVTGSMGLIVSSSPNIWVMIGLRLIQGAGSAALPALGSVVIARVTGERYRGEAMGVLLAAIGVAAALGPFIGGIFVQAFGWRSVFLLPGVLVFLAPVAWRLLPAHLDQGTPQRFDIFGSFLLLAATGVVMVGMTSMQGGSWTGAALGLVIGASLVSVLVVHTKRSSHPLLPPRLFKVRAYVALCIIAVVSNSIRFSTIVLSSVLLVQVGQHSPIWVGVGLLPGALAQALLSAPVGRWSDRVGARLPVKIGSVIFSICTLSLMWFADGNIIGTAIGLGLAGLAFTLQQSPIVTAVSLVVKPKDTGVAMGIFMMLFFLGGGMGVTLSMVFVDVTSSVTTAWLGPVTGAGAPFANAMGLLALISLLAFPFLSQVPERRVDENAA